MNGPEFPERHGDGDPEYSEIGPGPGLPPPSAIESLVNALLEAGPEVAGHVVGAAREVVLAAHTVVDAAQRAVEEQLGARQPRAGGTAGSAAPGAEDPAAGATVHHLDVGE